MIDQAITELVQYGLDTGLVAPEDKVFVTNQILEALGWSLTRRHQEVGVQRSWNRF